MRLNEIIPCDYVTEVTSIAFDSRTVRPGALFFCLEGAADGHDFAFQAVLRGAVAIVCSRPLGLGVPEVVVKDTRAALTNACAAFWHHPERRLKLIAVTGTNGKTTTTYIIKSILEAAGYSAGVIGTNSVEYAGHSYPASLTTPDPTDLFRIFSDMADAGVGYVVMEASAHALALKKLDGLTFEAAAFTNLSRDHLDYFKTMDAYAAAKKRLFTGIAVRHAVINVDDEFGRELALECPAPVVTYGCTYPADVFAIDLKMSVGGLKYVLNLADDVAEVKFNLPGRFNMYNTLCAAATGKALKIPIKHIVRGIRAVTRVEGRFNVLFTGKCGVIIDFAHTDDGLKNVLTTVREFAPGRIITVFGCGGNRDRTKRPVMGRIVTELSDFAVITSDNPRFEEPMDIIADIKKGITVDNYEVEPDRRRAIVRALDLAGKDDIVLIAGKGAEKYQEIRGVKYEYNDEAFVLSLGDGK